MNDKPTTQQLQDAALAAGYEVSLTHCECRGRIPFLYSPTRNLGEFSKWTPATDPADAARLAIDAGISVKIVYPFISARLYSDHSLLPIFNKIVDVRKCKSKEQAYCKAVTDCASAIGKQMRTGE